MALVSKVASPKKHTQNRIQFQTKVVKSLFLNVYLPFEAGHGYIAEIWEYPPPQGQNQREVSQVNIF